MAAQGGEENWLPRMTKAFIALDSSSHAIDTAAFAAAMEKVWWWPCGAATPPVWGVNCPKAAASNAPPAPPAAVAA